MTLPLLTVDNLSVSFLQHGRWLRALHDVSFKIERAEAFALVGESGCGKSTIALSVLSYLPTNARIDAGGISFEGCNLMTLDARSLRAIRGRKIAAVYQNPDSALNPSRTIGLQIGEIYVHHFKLTWRAARDAARDALRRVQIADAERVLGLYPHEISGGMQQRVMIAMALSMEPMLLVLDEPTTALDTTVQAEILRLFESLRRDRHTALLFISHNLGLVRHLVDRVGVMYAGEIVEEGKASAVLSRPQHPYSAALINCVPTYDIHKAVNRLRSINGRPPTLEEPRHGCSFSPRCPIAKEACQSVHPHLITDAEAHSVRCPYVGSITTHNPLPQTVTQESRRADLEPLLLCSNITRKFARKIAVRGLSLTIERGETVGLVGESGSGKSTLARIIAGLTSPDEGAVVFEGRKLSSRAVHRRARDRRELQMVFQSPDTTLNPRHRIGAVLRRSVRQLGGLTGAACGKRVIELLEGVQLTPAHANSFPRRLSGGQRQRVAIARAFAGAPKLVVLDEPTSALDVSVQAAIINILLELQRTHAFSYLFISHDLSVVRYVSDRIAVMYHGEIIEIGPAERIFEGPQHPYTRMLIDAAPDVSAWNLKLSGASKSANITAPINVDGCPFAPRCSLAMPHCATSRPPVRADGLNHSISCWRSLDELKSSSRPRDEEEGVPRA